MTHGRARAAVASGFVLLVLAYGYLALVPERLVLALGLQAMVAIAAAAYARVGRSPQERAFATMLACWCALAGPFGALISLAAAFARPQRATAKEGAFARWIQRTIADHGRTRVMDWRRALRDDRLRIDGVDHARSFRDVLTENDQPAKLRALSAMARGYTPEFAPALRLALRDEDAAVRVLAAGVLARLQAYHGARIEALKREALAQPRRIRALAQAHFEFAQSGVLSSERRRGHLDEAYSSLCAYLLDWPEDDAAKALLHTIVPALGRDAHDHGADDKQ